MEFTVKDFFSVYRYRKYEVMLELGDGQSVLVGEEDTKLVEAFGDIVVGEIYVDDGGKVHVCPKVETTIVKREATA